MEEEEPVGASVLEAEMLKRVLLVELSSKLLFPGEVLLDRKFDEDSKGSR